MHTDYMKFNFQNSTNNDGIYKMTESSSSPSSATTIISPRNDFENNVIEMPPSPDIQSSIDTNIDSSPAVSNLISPLHMKIR